MNLVTLFDDIVEHDCFYKRIIAADDPMARKIGWICISCGQTFEIRLVDAKVGVCPEWAKELLLTVEGRVKMVTFLTAGHTLIVFDEVAL